MVTFPVDDVTPAAEPLPTQPVGGLFPDALAFGGDPTLPVLVPNGVHPLLDAVGRAFADHRPLVLSPDAVWLTIAQGVAQHVRLNADELRPLLVSHAGRKRLEVMVDGPMPRDADSWRDLVGMFHKLLATEIRDADLFECDFSTSTRVEQVAGRVVQLDAYSPYFAVVVMFVCGIPSITLTGTVEDWQKIRARVDRIAKFGLEQWCRSLAPIADHFVSAAAGHADTAFWRRIYSPIDAYGGAVITGWAARLYPYLQHKGVVDFPNPLLKLPLGEPRDVAPVDGFYRGPGFGSDSVPATLSRVIVTINDRVEGENRSVALNAGLVGVAQDGDGALRPVAGWYLAPAPIEIEDVIDRIVRDHETTPPREAGHFFDGTADVVAIYRRIGSASLFDGAWRLLPAAERRGAWRGEGHLPIDAIIDLADGRSLTAADDYDTETTYWVVCRVEDKAMVDRPEDVPVFGTSLALILNAALDSGGDFSHLQTGWLAQLERT